MYLYQENLSLVWVNMHVCRYAYISMYRMCMLVYVYVQACMYHICFRYRITLIRNAQTQKELTEKKILVFMKVRGCGCVHACTWVSCTHMYMSVNICGYAHQCTFMHIATKQVTLQLKNLFFHKYSQIIQATSESGLLNTSESGLFLNLFIFYNIQYNTIQKITLFIGKSF